MITYIATFHTHLGALRFHRALVAAGDSSAVMMPVPRALSASCGTCVRFEMQARGEWISEDLDSIYTAEANGYDRIYLNE